MRGTRGVREGTEQRLVKVSQLFLSETVARKCEIKHWYTSGADKQKVGWSGYGHVIAEFSKMDRFSKLWGYGLGTLRHNQIFSDG